MPKDVWKHLLLNGCLSLQNFVSLTFWYKNCLFVNFKDFKVKLNISLFAILAFPKLSCDTIHFIDAGVDRPNVIGENLAIGTAMNNGYSVKQAVAFWYAQGLEYDYTNEQTNPVTGEEQIVMMNINQYLIVISLFHMHSSSSIRRFLLRKSYFQIENRRIFDVCNILAEYAACFMIRLSRDDLDKQYLYLRCFHSNDVERHYKHRLFYAQEKERILCCCSLPQKRKPTRVLHDQRRNASQKWANVISSLHFLLCNNPRTLTLHSRVQCTFVFILSQYYVFGIQSYLWLLENVWGVYTNVQYFKTN